MIALEVQIVCAVVLDLLLGDPPRLPHPVQWIGALAARLETWSRATVKSEYLAGTLTFAGVLLLVGLGTMGLMCGATLLHPRLGDGWAIYLLYTGIAMRSLWAHALDVERSLRNSALAQARRKLAKIVGRDTASLDETQIVRATVESVAESLVDGITAPLFYAVLLGPVGMMVYKAVNTMDSMFGYRTVRYERFGKIAARADDLANFLPARLTSLLTVPAAAVLGYAPRRCLRILIRDRHQHPSPNAAYPEAAVAGALGVRLGGLSHYQGHPATKPHLGDPVFPLATDHIQRALRLVMTTALLTTLLFLLLRLLLKTAFA